HLELFGTPLVAITAVYPRLSSVDERQYTELAARRLRIPLHTWEPQTSPLDDLEDWVALVLIHSIGNEQKVAFIGFFCLFPILLNTIDGVRGIDPALIETARAFNVPRFERIRRLVLPAAAPQIAAGMRTSVSLAVITMVLSEYFSSTSGIGYVLLISKNTYQFAPMWAAIVLIGLLGYLLNVVFLILERRLLAWHRGWRATAAA
ncbi:MAG: ABC transporter permease subunit, partial [Actinomycetota bacterium]|nr:ABC transporter permease subunit [Actinomycetota bacterium]